MSWFNQWMETTLKQMGKAFVQVIVDDYFKQGVEALFDRDYQSAFERFEVSSKSHPIAQYHIGCMLFNGKGTGKNYLRAVECFTLSSKYVPQAIYALAKINRDGAVGVPVNKQEALKWFNILGAKDEDFAAQERDAIEKDLSHEQILAAQQSSDDWIANNPMWDQWIIWTTAERDLAFDNI